VSEKPLVDPHLGPAPDELIIEEIVLGEGAEAQPGQTAVVHYVGVGVSSGEEFDSSWNRDEPFDFPLGAGYVIKGWDQGVVGMRVGGRRRLVIPSSLGYGARGAGGVIAPNETLIFVVDLLELR
jgi:peptidylprolyl isomerase